MVNFSWHFFPFTKSKKGISPFFHSLTAAAAAAVALMTFSLTLALLRFVGSFHRFRVSFFFTSLTLASLRHSFSLPINDILSMHAYLSNVWWTRLPLAASISLALRFNSLLSLLSFFSSLSARSLLPLHLFFMCPATESFHRSGHSVFLDVGTSGPRVPSPSPLPRLLMWRRSIAFFVCVCLFVSTLNRFTLASMQPG